MVACERVSDRSMRPVSRDYRKSTEWKIIIIIPDWNQIIINSHSGLESNNY